MIIDSSFLIFGVLHATVIKMSLPEKKHFKDFSQIVNDPKYQVDYVKPKKKHKDPNDIPSLPVIKQIRK